MHVTIRVKNYREQGREETLKLLGVEFVRRFTLHIVPRGFRRIRHAGLLMQRRRTEYLAICREFLKDRLPPQAPTESLPEEDPVPDQDAREEDHEDHEEKGDQSTPPRRCPRCLGRQFEFIESYDPYRDDPRRLRRFQTRPP